MNSLPKILYLDLSTWRCGAQSKIDKNTLGKGTTSLLNRWGFSCCLGQFIQQTSKEIDISNITVPKHVNGCPIELTEEFFVHSTFTIQCIGINDNEKTSIKEKIILLKKEVEKIGRKLIVIDSKSVNDSKPPVSENIHEPEPVLV